MRGLLLFLSLAVKKNRPGWGCPIIAKITLFEKPLRLNIRRDFSF
jgi:hypothetical protein